MSEELKTLKDFEDYSKEQTGNRVIGRIKEEAIKWIKEDLRCMVSMERQSYLWDCAETRIEWIMEFFNITEDDLK